MYYIKHTYTFPKVCLLIWFIINDIPLSMSIHSAHILISKYLCPLKGTRVPWTKD